VDLVIETVGAATWAHSLKSVDERGRIVVAGATTGPSADADLARVFMRRIEILGSSMGTRDELEDLVRFLTVTGARPIIDSERPLADAADALSAMLAGQAFGKLILIP
jgi:NADPH:quinone reductase-like Zn-dependent oxidoreductase